MPISMVRLRRRSSSSCWRVSRGRGRRRPGCPACARPRAPARPPSPAPARTPRRRRRAGCPHPESRSRQAALRACGQSCSARACGETLVPHHQTLSAARSLAERARGLRSRSAPLAGTTCLVRMRSTRRSAAVASRPAPAAAAWRCGPPASGRRSRTAGRPGAGSRPPPSRNRSSSASSSLTAMRSAWNVRVAGFLCRTRGAAWRAATNAASLPVVSRSPASRASTIALRDARARTAPRRTRG